MVSELQDLEGINDDVVLFGLEDAPESAANQPAPDAGTVLRRQMVYSADAPLPARGGRIAEFREADGSEAVLAQRGAALTGSLPEFVTLYDRWGNPHKQHRLKADYYLRKTVLDEATGKRVRVFYAKQMVQPSKPTEKCLHESCKAVFVDAWERRRHIKSKHTTLWERLEAKERQDQADASEARIVSAVLAGVGEIVKQMAVLLAPRADQSVLPAREASEETRQKRLLALTRAREAKRLQREQQPS